MPRARHEKVSASFDEGALADANLQWPLVFSPPQLIGVTLMIWIWLSAGGRTTADRPVQKTMAMRRASLPHTRTHPHRDGGAED